MSAKYVFVTGGVVSSLGKGTTAAALGRLLKARGWTVSMQKCEPYYNIEPGLLSPLQQGEAFMTEDGIATDLDFGHYERFIDTDLRGDANTTTGKIHQALMAHELRGDYHGTTIQVVPHVTDEIKYRIRTAAENSGADIAIIEIGGTVGDMESSPYMEAIRQMKWELGPKNACFVHVTLLPFISAAGEMKTKPTQHSVKLLRSIGIQPDVIVTRTEHPITNDAKDKIALFCNVRSGNVIQNVDVDTLYDIPLMLEKEGFGKVVCRELGLADREPDLQDWTNFAAKVKSFSKTTKVAIVGKYVSLHAAYMSVKEALEHAGIDADTRVDIAWIDSAELNDQNAAEILGDCKGIVIPGGYGSRAAEGIIAAASYARKNKVPCLMIGFGMQLGVVEAVRSLLYLSGANSTEVDENAAPAVITIPADRMDSNQGRGHARQGGMDVQLRIGQLREIYQAESIHERHSNRYEVASDFVRPLEERGFRFTAWCEAYPEAFELPGHPFYIGVLFHPEYISRPNRPHPLFTSLLRAAENE